MNHHENRKGSQEGLRIFHGTMEVAGQASLAVAGLRQLSLDATLGVYRADPYSAIIPDEVLFPCGELSFPSRQLKILDFMIRNVARHDVFHFHAGSTFMKGNRDLSFLAKKHKQVFFEFHGSEIRQGNFWNDNPYARYIKNYQSNPALYERACQLAQHAQAFIVHDYELSRYLPADVATFFVPLRIDLSAFEPMFPADDGHRLRIVHAPTNREVKGTRFILEAVERLSQKYDFDFELIEKLPPDVAYEAISKADIVIDQLLIGIYSAVSIEAMAMGKPVVAFLRDEMVESYPEDLPIVNATIETLYDRLEELLLDGHRRELLGKAGREYVENYHDYRAIAQVLRDIYQTGAGPLTAQAAYARVKELARIVTPC